MRILMAVVSDIATDARVRREAETLAADGHVVRVIAFDYGIRRPATRSDNGVEYRLFPFAPRGESRLRRLLGAARFFMRAWSAILSWPVDAIHMHNLHLAVPCMVTAAARRVPLVYDAHELVVPKYGPPVRWFVSLYERLVWRRSASVITTNESRARHLHRRYGGPRPTVLGNFPTTPPTVEPEDLRGPLDIPARSPILLYQGGFYIGARCFDTVAEALRLLPGWHWVLVGFGSDHAREELHRIAGEAEIAERTHILPPVRLDRLLDVTAGADIGLVPLRRTELNNYLGDTNKLFEYLMVGVPAVGSDFPEIHRAILDNGIGPVGAVFEPTDPASIARAIESVHANLHELRMRASEVGRRYFSWEGEAPKLSQLYRDLTAANGRA